MVAAVKIYLDIDDVLADFRSHIIARGVTSYTGTFYTNDPATWTAAQTKSDMEANVVMAQENFWLDIPVAEGAFEIIATAAMRGEVHLLTALPGRVDPSIHSDIAAQKLVWAENKLHFPVERVHTCMREEKQTFALHPHANVFGPGPVLVDDNKRTCREWRERGGHAIQHKDWRKTVDELKRIL